jgi:transposase
VLGRKRQVLTDTLGLLLAVSVHPASVQNRDGAETLLGEARRSFPFLERIIAEAGDQGQKMEAVVARTGVWELQIVRRCDRPRFGVLPKRWMSRGRWLGSAAVVGWPATTSGTLARRRPSCAWP